MDNVKTVGAYLKDQLAAIDDSRIKEIRGMGLLLGMEMTVEVAPMVNSCLKQGLLLLNAGPNVIRFLPPLNITEELVDSAVAILKKFSKRRRNMEITTKYKGRDFLSLYDYTGEDIAYFLDVADALKKSKRRGYHGISSGRTMGCFSPKAPRGPECPFR